MSFFQNLPQELQLRVAELCTRDTLCALSATSKTYHQLLTPVLYRVVDVSSHNGPDINVELSSIKLPADWAANRLNPADDVAYHRQRMLIRTLRARPSLGEHVRILRWTVVDTPKDFYRDVVSPLFDQYNQGDISRRKLAALMQEYNLTNCASSLWEAFAAFTRVLEVDLAFIDNDIREEDPPPPLFRQAESLRLSGLASSFLVKSILKSIDPASLRHLHLNNLNQFAELQGVREELPLRQKGKLRPYPRLVPGTNGLMRTHLQGCIGRWPNLQSLFIDTNGLAGPELAEPGQGVAPGEVLVAEAEDARYRELGAFIRSVAGSLRAFRFQQGPTNDMSQNGWRRLRGTPARSALRAPPDGPRLMDVLFRRHILGAILDSPWPRLEKMELFGVASYSYSEGGMEPVVNCSLPDETLSQIRAAVGPGPALDIRPDATRLFWRTTDDLWAANSGVPSVDTDEWTENEEDHDEDEDEDDVTGKS